MESRFFIPALAFLIFSNCSKKDVVESSYPSGKPRVIITHKKWFFSNDWVPVHHREYYFNKNEKFSSPLKDNLYSGTAKSWYQRGKLKSTGSYTRGQRNGKWEFYHEKSGDLSARGYYAKDKKQGKWEEWWPGYIKKSRGEFENNSQSGNWLFWNEHEILVKKTTCFKGIEWGSTEVYFDNGVPKKKFSCYQGKKAGDFKKYHENGQIRAQGKYNKSSRKEGLWEGFHSNGKQASRENFVTGKRQDTVFFWDDQGSLTARGDFHEGTGTLENFNGEGARTEIREFVRGKMHGKRVKYYPSGKMKSLTNYEKDEPQSYIHWHESKEGRHTIIQQGRYKSGHREGIWKWYSETGKLIEEANYLQGKKHGESRFYHARTGKLTRTQVYDRGVAKVAKLH